MFVCLCGDCQLLIEFYSSSVPYVCLSVWWLSAVDWVVLQQWSVCLFVCVVIVSCWLSRTPAAVRMFVCLCGDCQLLIESYSSSGLYVCLSVWWLSAVDWVVLQQRSVCLFVCVVIVSCWLSLTPAAVRMFVCLCGDCQLLIESYSSSGRYVCLFVWWLSAIDWVVLQQWSVCLFVCVVIVSCWLSPTPAAVRIALELRWKRLSFSSCLSLSTNLAVFLVAWWVAYVCSFIVILTCFLTDRKFQTQGLAWLLWM